LISLLRRLVSDYASAAFGIASVRTRVIYSRVAPASCSDVQLRCRVASATVTFRQDQKPIRNYRFRIRKGEEYPR
jgi:hypothetical protein